MRCDKSNLDYINWISGYLNYSMIYILNEQRETYIGEVVNFQKTDEAASEAETNRPE